jgi:hypothetical protein
MAKPNRWVLLGSGGLAALVAVSACLMLLSTGPSYVHKQAEVLSSFNVAPGAEPQCPRGGSGRFRRFGAGHRCDPDHRAAGHL